MEQEKGKYLSNLQRRVPCLRNFDRMEGKLAHQLGQRTEQGKDELMLVLLSIFSQHRAPTSSQVNQSLKKQNHSSLNIVNK